MSIVERGNKLESSVDFTPFIKALKKHWLKIVLFTLLVTAAFIPVTMRMTAQYVSSATVLLKSQEDNATPIESIDKYDSTREPYYITQFNLMQTRVVLEKAIRDMKLADDPRYNGGLSLVERQDEWPDSAKARMDATVKLLRRNLSFSEVRLTQLVRISYQSPDNREAARIADGVAKAFIDYTVDQKVQKTIASQEWNKAQMADLKQQIVAKKKQMDEFLKQEGLITFRDIDGYETEDMGIVMNKLADARERRLTAQADYEIVARNQDAPIEEIASMPEISGHAQMQDLRIAMIQAKRNLYDLQNRYGPKHNKILEANSEIEAIEVQTRKLLLELKDGLYKKYQSLLAKEQKFQEYLDKQRKDFSSMVAKRNEYENMQTDLEKTEDLYKQLFSRSKEQALYAKYREPDAILYDPASVSEKPQKPNKNLLVVMVFILSFAGSTLLVIIRAAMDQKLHTLDQLPRKLGLTPLVDLPDFNESKKETLSREQLVPLIANNRFAMEQFHGMRTALLLNTPSAQRIGVLASDEGEGASLVAQLLAHSLSHNHKTLLIDLDYRSQQSLSLSHSLASQTVGADDEEPPFEVNGVAQWIKGVDNPQGLILAVAPQYDFLPRGELDISPLLLFGNQAFQQMMDSLSQSYDKIVVNLPSLADNKDSQLAAQAVDGVVIVVQAEHRRIHTINKDIDKLAEHSIALYGGVLNRTLDDNLQSEESLQFIEQSSLSTLAMES